MISYTIVLKQSGLKDIKQISKLPRGLTFSEMRTAIEQHVPAGYKYTAWDSKNLIFVYTR